MVWDPAHMGMCTRLTCLSASRGLPGLALVPAHALYPKENLHPPPLLTKALSNFLGQDSTSFSSSFSFSSSSSSSNRTSIKVLPVNTWFSGPEHPQHLQLSLEPGSEHLSIQAAGGCQTSPSTQPSSTITGIMSLSGCFVGGVICETGLVHLSVCPCGPPEGMPGASISCAWLLAVL